MPHRAKFADFSFDSSQFKLAASMLEKNDYTGSDVLYTMDSDGVSSLCIYATDGSSCRIQVLETRPDCRRCGLGSLLLEFLKREHESLNLHSLENAETFYKHHGFIDADEPHELIFQ